MHKLILFLILVGLAVPCSAQSDSTWATEAHGTVSFNQVGFQRWHDGGINSLALGSGVRFQAAKTSTLNEQEYEVRLAFGVVKQGGVELRKSDDVIHLRGALTFPAIPVFGQLSPALTMDFRSQFASGFQYNDGDSTAEQLQISAFLSPAIFTQSVGLDYPIQSWLDVRIGIANKETIVTMRELRGRYKVAPDKILRWQFGSSGRVHFERTIFTNVHLKSTLTLFLAFNQQSPPDTIWETLVTMDVNSWLRVNAEYTARYDQDLSSYIQQKQSLAVGVSFKLL